MGEVFANRFSDRGSIPLISIYNSSNYIFKIPKELGNIRNHPLKGWFFAFIIVYYKES